MWTQLALRESSNFVLACVSRNSYHFKKFTQIKQGIGYICLAEQYLTSYLLAFT